MGQILAIFLKVHIYLKLQEVFELVFASLFDVFAASNV